MVKIKKLVKLTKKKLKRMDRLLKKKRLKEWARLVKERDGDSCVICHAHKGDLYINKKGKTLKVIIHAHHIIPKEILEFIYDIMNGISLCPKHHKYCKEISAHKNSFVFIIWLMENRPEQYVYLKSKLMLA